MNSVGLCLCGVLNPLAHTILPPLSAEFPELHLNVERSWIPLTKADQDIFPELLKIGK